jgi:hypothetical protein
MRARPFFFKSAVVVTLVLFENEEVEEEWLRAGPEEE